MDKPEAAGTRPICETAQPGDYWWCACGLSKSQPFCDGSHKGSGFKSLPVTIDAEKPVAWCTCKQTGTPPFCDGSHKKLTDS